MARGGKRDGAGRPAGAITRRTREVAERVVATGMSPLEVMIDNMRHFQQVALDAEATLEGLTASEFSEQVPPDASPEDQFKFLLAQVKKTAGFRQMAQDAARDAAPYVHAKLSSIAHTDPEGGVLKVLFQTIYEPKPE
ncbi:MAG: hypothetical protein QHC90_13220 [Shinella sp.]|nr:hypothetical protein [Shinella sp.]